MNISGYMVNIRLIKRCADHIINSIKYSFRTKSIYIKFNLYDLDVEEYYSKIKCNFSRYDERNKLAIRQLTNIEHQILKNYIQLTQNPVYTIREQLMNYYIKLYHKDTNRIIGRSSKLTIILKISGLWLTNKEHGLTFRFIIVDSK